MPSVSLSIGLGSIGSLRVDGARADGYMFNVHSRGSVLNVDLTPSPSPSPSHSRSSSSTRRDHFSGHSARADHSAPNATSGAKSYQAHQRRNPTPAAASSSFEEEVLRATSQERELRAQLDASYREMIARARAMEAYPHRPSLSFTQAELRAFMPKEGAFERHPDSDSSRSRSRSRRPSHAPPAWYAHEDHAFPFTGAQPNSSSAHSTEAQRKRQRQREQYERAEREMERKIREREELRLAEEARRRRQARQEEEERQKREAQRAEERRRRAAAEAYQRKQAYARLLRDVWARYEAVPAAHPLTFDTITWPVAVRPRDCWGLTREAIREFILSEVHSAGMSPRARVQTALRRWHPDKFGPSTMGRVAVEDREQVGEAVRTVAGHLNAILKEIAEKR